MSIAFSKAESADNISCSNCQFMRRVEIPAI
uniref:Uncharacterized protein n=1 Tax=Anguilla anguilla TaxID=7936 RepID=A0A0E9QYR9_ANGAN